MYFSLNGFPEQLDIGSEGSAVMYLIQVFKGDIDYDPHNALKSDGKFGPMLEAAVKRFQKKHGLDVDGRFGPQTRAKFEEVFLPIKLSAKFLKPYTIAVNLEGNTEVYYG